jgi:hypothetical protein
VYLPDKEYWVDAHLDIAEGVFTVEERRLAFEWCHSLIQEPRPEPNVRNPGDSRLFDLDVYFAWLPGTDIEAHWMVDDREHIVYVVHIGRNSPGDIVPLDPS